MEEKVFRLRPDHFDQWADMRRIQPVHAAEAPRQPAQGGVWNPVFNTDRHGVCFQFVGNSLQPGGDGFLQQRFRLLRVQIRVNFLLHHTVYVRETVQLTLPPALHHGQRRVFQYGIDHRLHDFVVQFPDMVLHDALDHARALQLIDFLPESAHFVVDSAAVRKTSGHGKAGSGL